MLILHGIWNGQNLLVWAEFITQAPIKSETKPGTKTKKEKDKSKRETHPFAAPPEQLKELLGNLAGNLLVESVPADFLQLTLPSTNKSGLFPIPSIQFYSYLKDRPLQVQIKPEELTNPNLIPLTEPAVDIKLATWTIPALILSPALALDFLLHLPVEQPSGISYGNSLLFWVEVAKFSLESLTQENYIPTLQSNPNPNTNGKNEDKITRTNEQTNPNYRACWQIVLTKPAEKAKLHQLVKLMPPVCRAFNRVTAAPPTGNSAKTKSKTPVGTAQTKPVALQLVLTFLNQTLDATLRQELAHDEHLYHRLTAFVNANLKINPPTNPGNSKKSVLDKNKNLTTLHATPLILQWLANLFTPTPRSLVGTQLQLDNFAQELYNWLSQLNPVPGHDAAFRTCFRLDPPEDTLPAGATTAVTLPIQQDNALLLEVTQPDTKPGLLSDNTRRRGTRNQLASAQNEKVNLANPPANWQISFYLQATSDPSLLVPARQVWLERSGTLSFLKRNFENPQERLLADLGRAARIFPHVEESLKTARPESLSLATQQAYLFLRQIAPLLEQSGFGVLLPAWWSKATTQKQIGIKLNLRPQTKDRSAATASGFAGLAGIVEYDWELALGDQLLTPAEFEKLAHLKVPLVQVRGEWLELKPEQIEATLNFFQQKYSGGTLPLQEALRIGLTEQTLTETGTVIETLPATSPLAITEFSSEGWLAELFAKLSQPTQIEEIAQPAQLQANLRAYQLKGLAWLAYLQTFGLGACLADDMGLGKTIQLISLLLYERELIADAEATTSRGTNEVDTLVAQPLSPPAPLLTSANARYPEIAKTEANQPVEAQVKNKSKSRNKVTKLASEVIAEPASGFIPLAPTLLVCPMSVVGNWSKELARFAPNLKVLVHHGSGRLGRAAFLEKVKHFDIVITTYSLLHRDSELFSGLLWGRVALDEAQNIKNPSARQSQAARKLKATYRVALTGTPIENRLAELWSILDFLNPGYLGTASQFRSQYIIPIERYREKKPAETLRKLIQPFVLRRLKTDKTIIADLPDKLEMKVWCNLTREQATLYEAVVKDMLAKIEEAEEGIARRGLVLATLTRLKQICNHPAHYLADKSSLTARSGKLNRLEEMLEEILAIGDKTLIFTQFAEMGALLQNYLQQKLGVEVLFLHGGTSKSKRDELVARFQEQSASAAEAEGSATLPALNVVKAGQSATSRQGRLAPIFILSLKAGGVGLNLTAASHVFHFDRWWNPAVENQATDRAFRIGQLKNVQVHKFVCIGTLEEKIDALIEQKQLLAQNIIGGSENWITELDNKQLRDLLTLSREAVSEAD